MHIAAALAEKGADYRPRTEHVTASGQPLFTNRLILEGSPYLIQHAHNPVDWYPWGPEAFAKARRENKPVFLSIGYSTCHWCHVMERDSFENVAIAQLLNQNFVAVKVDRERRPDVDETYMSAVVLLNGRGGWPMSSFLTPDGKPFFGGTYFPPAEFQGIVTQVSKVWRDDRPGLIEYADRVVVALAQQTAVAAQASRVNDAVVA